MNGLIRNVIFVFSGGTVVLAGGTVKIFTGLEDLLLEMQESRKQVADGGYLEAEDGPISLKPFAKLQPDGQDVPIFYLYGSLGYVLVDNALLPPGHLLLLQEAQVDCHQEQEDVLHPQREGGVGGEVIVQWKSNSDFSNIMNDVRWKLV